MGFNLDHGIEVFVAKLNGYKAHIADDLFSNA